MKNKKDLPVKILVFRWIARIWSFVVLVFALMMTFSPDQHAAGDPLPVSTYVLLGLWGLSVVGLMMGWLWERLGALIAIGSLALRELLYLIVNGDWILNFLLVWAAFLPPAILFLLAWRMEKKFQ